MNTIAKVGVVGAGTMGHGITQSAAAGGIAVVLVDVAEAAVLLAVMEVFHRDFGDTKYRPAPLLREMVAAGTLGRKTGRGFHHYG
jgi:3-hydroxyacyl-CoA dehydrogenase